MIALYTAEFTCAPIPFRVLFLHWVRFGHPPNAFFYNERLPVNANRPDRYTQCLFLLVQPPDVVIVR